MVSQLGYAQVTAPVPYMWPFARKIASSDAPWAISTYGRFARAPRLPRRTWSLHGRVIDIASSTRPCHFRQRWNTGLVRRKHPVDC